MQCFCSVGNATVVTHGRTASWSDGCLSALRFVLAPYCSHPRVGGVLLFCLPVLLTFQNILDDLRGRPDMFIDDDEQPASKTATGWYLETLGRYGDQVSWDVFWGQLKDAVKETSLDGARWRYMLHQLHQDKQQLHFQHVVSRTSDSPGKLESNDFLLFTNLTGVCLFFTVHDGMQISGRSWFALLFACQSEGKPVVSPAQLLQAACWYNAAGMHNQFSTLSSDDAPCVLLVCVCVCLSLQSTKPWLKSFSWQ